MYLGPAGQTGNFIRDAERRDSTFGEGVRIYNLAITWRGSVWPARLRLVRFYSEKLEAPPGFEPGVEVLQTSALPLGDGADLA